MRGLLFQVNYAAKTLQSFIDEGLWDELRVETNLGLTVGQGTRAPLMPANAKVVETKTYDSHTIVRYRRS